jgi:hypothetical protein
MCHTWDDFLSLYFTAYCAFLNRLLDEGGVYIGARASYFKVAAELQLSEEVRCGFFAIDTLIAVAP